MEFMQNMFRHSFMLQKKEIKFEYISFRNIIIFINVWCKCAMLCFFLPYIFFYKKKLYMKRIFVFLFVFWCKKRVREGNNWINRCWNDRDQIKWKWISFFASKKKNNMSVKETLYLHSTLLAVLHNQALVWILFTHCDEQKCKKMKYWFFAGEILFSRRTIKFDEILWK